MSVSSSSQAVVGRPLVSVDNGAREYPSLNDRKECRCCSAVVWTRNEKALAGVSIHCTKDPHPFSVIPCGTFSCRTWPHPSLLFFQAAGPPRGLGGEGFAIIQVMMLPSRVFLHVPTASSEIPVYAAIPTLVRLLELK